MSRTSIRDQRGPATLFVALPHDPLDGNGDAHWWHAIEDSVEAGAGPEWLALALRSAARPRVIGLAPAALVRLSFSPPAEGAISPRQVEAIARMAAVEQSLGEPATLHTASRRLDGDPPSIVTAVAANAKMQEWLDWADGLGIGLDHVIPAAMVLPLGEDWTAAQVGTERLLGRRGMVLPEEPALKDTLSGDGDEPVELDRQAVELALLRLAEVPQPDLRSGKFARRRRIVIERTALRELALLTLAIILVSTLIAVVLIVRLDASRSALDAETLEIARAAAGPAVTLENAEAVLSARASPAGGGPMSSAVAAVIARLQAEQNLSLSALGYSGGILNFTVSGQGADAINRLLLALQRDGYRVTAVPRTERDGRTLAEVTLREGP